MSRWTGPNPGANYRRWRGKLRHFEMADLQAGIVMNRIIYIIGLVVVIIAVLGFFGLR